MTAVLPGDLGVGIGWRPQLAHLLAGLPDLRLSEVVAENLRPAHLPAALTDLTARGVTVIPHGVSLSLGGAEPVDRTRLSHLAACASALGAPLVSEHVAFVRAGGVEAGHLLPVPRTRDSLDVLCENIHVAQAELPVPLALENVAATLDWPDAQMDEAAFLAELVERTGVLLLLDVANLYANARNHGYDAVTFLDTIPLDRVAYVHVGGGIEHDGLYHDTHAHPVPAAVLELLTALCERRRPSGILFERDAAFPPEDVLRAELAALARAAGRAASTAESTAASQAGPGRDRDA